MFAARYFPQMAGENDAHVCIGSVRLPDTADTADTAATGKDTTDTGVLLASGLGDVAPAKRSKTAAADDGRAGGEGERVVDWTDDDDDDDHGGAKEEGEEEGEKEGEEEGEEKTVGDTKA